MTQRLNHSPWEPPIQWTYVDRYLFWRPEAVWTWARKRSLMRLMNTSGAHLCLLIGTRLNQVFVQGPTDLQAEQEDGCKSNRVAPEQSWSVCLLSILHFYWDIFFLNFCLLIYHYPGQSFFFAFGAGHFVGDHTILEVVRKAGFKVDQVRYFWNQEYGAYAFISTTI